MFIQVQKLTMENIESLKTFPDYDGEKSVSSMNIIIRLNKEFLYLYCKIFNDVYHKMHYKNQSIVIESINRALRPTLVKEKAV